MPIYLYHYIPISHRARKKLCSKIASSYIVLLAAPHTALTVRAGTTVAKKAASLHYINFHVACFSLQYSTVLVLTYLPCSILVRRPKRLQTFKHFAQKPVNPTQSSPPPAHCVKGFSLHPTLYLLLCTTQCFYFVVVKINHSKV